MESTTFRTEYNFNIISNVRMGIYHNYALKHYWIESAMQSDSSKQDVGLSGQIDLP